MHLLKHLAKHHDADQRDWQATQDLRAHRCHFCPKSFPSERGFRTHLGYHAKRDRGQQYHDNKTLPVESAAQAPARDGSNLQLDGEDPFDKLRPLLRNDFEYWTSSGARVNMSTKYRVPGKKFWSLSVQAMRARLKPRKEIRWTISCLDGSTISSAEQCGDIVSALVIQHQLQMRRGITADASLCDLYRQVMVDLILQGRWTELKRLQNFSFGKGEDARRCAQVMAQEDVTVDAQTI